MGKQLGIILLGLFIMGYGCKGNKESTNAEVDRDDIYNEVNWTRNDLNNARSEIKFINRCKQNKNSIYTDSLAKFYKKKGIRTLKKQSEYEKSLIIQEDSLYTHLNQKLNDLDSLNRVIREHR